MWEPNHEKHMKGLAWIMEVAGSEDRAFGPLSLSLSVTLGKLQPWLAQHCPYGYLQSEIRWLCHEPNWHLFPEGIYNLLDDKRWTPESQLENPRAESRRGKGTWSDVWRQEHQGRERSSVLPALGVLNNSYLICYAGLSVTFQYFEKYSLTSEPSKLM